MPIHIRKINVQNLGPLQKFTLELGPLNLIYGANENGKTYLVEFIVRSLFRNTRHWKMRGEKGIGRVAVAGLDDGSLLHFSPSSAKKLEDFFEESHPGLPADFSRLLVVRGAEVEIANVDGGIDKSILKRLLSNKDVLDNVQNRISKTLRESQLDNNMIIGPKRGEISTRFELEKQFVHLNKLFDQIDRAYSGGRRRTLFEKKERLGSEIQKMLQAKQYLAYAIDKEIKRLKEQINRIPADLIQEVRTKLTLYKQKDFEYKRKQEALQGAELRSQDYEWLKNAHQVYQNALLKQHRRPKPYLLIAGVLSLIGAGVLGFLAMPIYAALALALVLVFGVLYFRQLHKFLSHISQNQEMAQISQTFAERFGKELSGLSGILEMLERMEEDYNNARLLRKQLHDDLNQLHGLKVAISDLIFSLLGERKDPRTWDEALRTVEDTLRKLEVRVRERELQLARLAVDPSDYQTRSPEMEFSKQRLDGLEEELRQTEAQIEEEHQKLSSLKHLICQQTDDDISNSWENVIGRLRERRERVLTGYKQKTAEIIGKIAVNEVVNDLRKDEDSKVTALLQSDEVQNPLFQVTKRYKQLDLRGDKLIAADDYHQFDLSELSTGAQEQILLALRMGISAKLMKKDRLFLILDDAFQYSDWQRRRFLVEKVVQLAGEGWQIIYFTMDDNIRDLFAQTAEDFGSQFRMVELTSTAV